MKHKRIAVMAALLLLLSFPASASLVSFLLIETGLSEGAPSTQYASLWESGLMAVFFDAGHIVTNSPIARMEKKPASDFSGFIETDFREATEGGAEYFVLGYLEFQNLGSGVSLSGITIKLYSVDWQELIFERHFTAGRVNLNEEYQSALNAGRIVISHIRDR